MAKRRRRLCRGVPGCGPASRSLRRASARGGRHAFLQAARGGGEGLATRFGGFHGTERVCIGDGLISSTAAGAILYRRPGPDDRAHPDPIPKADLRSATSEAGDREVAAFRADLLGARAG